MTQERYSLSTKVEHSCCYTVAIIDRTKGNRLNRVAEFNDIELAAKVVDLLNILDLSRTATEDSKP